MADTINSGERAGRITQLDALRGLAALVVVFHHARNMLSQSAPPAYLLPIFSGRKSVTLFFVLSGYVLALPYWEGRQQGYAKYLVRRICRIYVPYVGALVLALLVGDHLLYAHLALSKWFYYTWHTPFTASLVLRQLIFASSSGNLASINTAFWSLRYEMEMSIVFPLICWVLLRTPLPIALILTFGAECVGNGTILGRVDAWSPEVAKTLLWASAFIFGALLSKHRQWIKSWYQRANLGTKLFLLGFVTIGYFQGGEETALANIPAACGVIVFAEFCRARRWLDTPFGEYLGKISYSLYLVHATFLFASFIFLYGKVPLVEVLAIYFVSSLGAAHLFWRLVEFPSMRLGKRLTRRKACSDAPYETVGA